MDSIIKEHIGYLEKVKEGVGNILVLFDKFRSEVMAPEFKAKLSEKFELYVKEKSRIEWAIVKFDIAPIGITLRSWAMELPDAEVLRRNLKEALKAIEDAVAKLRFVTGKAEVDFKLELASIRVNVDKNFGVQLIALNNKLSIMCKFQDECEN